MANRQTWFGTMGHERWIPTPAINPEYSRTGFSSEAEYLNGGGGVRESKSAHNSYILSWPPSKTREAIRSISDFADGVFDTTDGINLIHWIDPMAADLNVLNMAWSFPAQASEDGVPLVEDARPLAVPTLANDYKYPARSAQYTLRPGDKVLEQYIPIPPGYAAWVGIHGLPSAQGKFVIRPYNGIEPDLDTLIVPNVLAVTTSLRVNTQISSTQYSGFILKLAPVAVNSVFTISGLMVQILPIGQTPERGDFISGQGHSGCQFVGKVSRTPYSAKLNRVAATARLTETGMYL